MGGSPSELRPPTALSKRAASNTTASSAGSSPGVQAESSVQAESGVQAAKGAQAASSTVLVVDDDQPIRDYLAAVLELEGYQCLRFPSSSSALEYLGRSGAEADLMLTDIKMPGGDGMSLLRSVKGFRPQLPVILVSGLYELALALDALELGADDYLKKPVEPSDVVNVVQKYLGSDLKRQEGAIQEALSEYLTQGDRRPRDSAHISAVFQQLGFKRYETFQHSKRVAAYARIFGEQCGLATAELDRLELGALLHDIGKIGIPRNVLLKPGKLNEEEWEVMKTHPTIGYRMMARFDELQDEAAIVYAHHERFDGKGYPRGLRGDQIPLGARLFSVVDTWDAITSERAYRATQSAAAARAEIERVSGTQFDPELTAVFSSIADDTFDKVRRQYPDPPVV